MKSDLFVTESISQAIGILRDAYSRLINRGYTDTAPSVVRLTEAIESLRPFLTVKTECKARGPRGAD